MKKLMLTLAIAMVLAPPAFAADAGQRRRQLPPFGKDKPIPAPKIAKKTLANGMTGVGGAAQRPAARRLRAGRARRRLRRRRQGPPGFANMMAGLLNEGTAKRNSRAIAEAAQGMGGSVGARRQQRRHAGLGQRAGLERRRHDGAAGRSGAPAIVPGQGSRAGQGQCAARPEGAGSAAGLPRRTRPEQGDLRRPPVRPRTSRPRTRSTRSTEDYAEARARASASVRTARCW